VTESPPMTEQRLPPHWRDAAHHWHNYGSPLRPCAADVRAMEEFVGRGRPDGGGRPVRALMLGVTPEIATMAWPAGTVLTAVDMSLPMIDCVWPGDVAMRRRAVHADWFDFAGGAGHFDVVIGDGTFALLDYPWQYRALAAKARHWLADDGIMVTRPFLQAPVRETPGAVFADLVANRIASFHSFKLRLAMALQESAESGVRMGDAYAAWERAAIDVDALTATTGWRRGVIETVRTWEGKDSRLSFPGAAEFDDAMGELFDKEDERHLPYELGERCPVVCFRPRAPVRSGLSREDRT
jgi:hypothetical protein